MSRYLLLVILNAPFMIAGLINALVNYKLSRLSKSKFIIRITFWIMVLVGLSLAEPIYNFLFSNNLTRTEPLSLFDVIEIACIVIVFLIISRSRARIDTLERKVQDLHQELSIKLSKSNKR